MPQQTDERLAWAVETLALASTDSVLEIGCGYGTAVFLVCQRLEGGHILAIDRSEKMIARATKKNEDYVASGKASFRTVALEDVDLDSERFDKIFAFNVNVFWAHPGRGLDTIKHSLTPNGRFYLFYGGWKGGRASGGIAEKVSRTLEDHGFAVTDTLAKELSTAPAVGMIARVS